MSPSDADTLLIVSPAAGGGRALRILPRISHTFDRLGIPAQVQVSSSADEPERLARDAALRGVRAVVAVGGDGLVSMVAAGILSAGATRAAVLGVVAAGTGDDFARALSLPRKDPVAAAEVIASGVVRQIDAATVTCGETEPHWFVNVANAGFDAQVSETANGMKVRLGGTATYVGALVSTLRRFRPARFTIAVDGAASNVVGAMLIAVGNGSSYGGGMRVTPGARVDDGELEACVVREMGRGEFVAKFAKVYRGSHASDPKVLMLHGAEIAVSAEPTQPVYADGERVGDLPATFRIHPGVLSVLVPSGPGAARP